MGWKSLSHSRSCHGNDLVDSPEASQDSSDEEYFHDDLTPSESQLAESLEPQLVESCEQPAVIQVEDSAGQAKSKRTGQKVFPAHLVL
uniref:Uncharacterized protein n=1 Tax=Sphaerodactylus townsendi TaxID=933632 RepID=A0ACB8ER83_9SAUR